jgi:glycosyltransferase involved in cell wall biosynthesis
MDENAAPLAHRGKMKTAETNPPGMQAMRNYAVALMGARMHYAVPRLLHESGHLERLFTDICASKGLPRILRAMPRPLQPQGLRRLLGRVPQGLPASRITAFNRFGWEYSRRRRAARTPAESTAVYLWAGKTFCELIIRAGIGDATGVYAFNSAGLELLRHARAMGLRTVLEQTIAPTRVESRLLAREYSIHPGWEPPPVQGVHESELADREQAEWDLADVILCGSDFVRQGIEECGGPAERCVVVPYGVKYPASEPAKKPHDGPVRVLTVGAVGLRKGSPYVLAAARSLRGKAAFRMVGSTATLPPKIIEELRLDVELCGGVPRTEIHRHYEWADVFLLPSVCEGSATATYEALAAGLPVIATPNTGAHLTEGASGFTVPVGDTGAIIEKLAALSEDRPLVATMSGHAHSQSSKLSLEAYQRNLNHALADPA